MTALENREGLRAGVAELVPRDGDVWMMIVGGPDSLRISLVQRDSGVGSGKYSVRAWQIWDHRETMILGR